MNKHIELRQKIQQNLKGIKNNEVRMKARFIILILESKTIKLGLVKNGIEKSTYYNWLKKIKENNFDLMCLESKSRRPHNSPNKISQEDEDLICDMSTDYGNSDLLLAILIKNEKGKDFGHTTICNVLKRNEISCTYKTIKPNKFNRRYSASKPLERVQVDTLWTGLTDSNGHRVYMAGMIDDCTRTGYGELSDDKSGYSATRTLENFIKIYGKPKLVQSDNGVEFTYRYISELNSKRKKEAVKSGFEQLLISEKIPHHLIRPATPQHNGKIERFNKTVLREFSARVADGLPLEEYRKLFKEYLEHYNTKRPHSSIKYLTPHEKFYKKDESNTA